MDAEADQYEDEEAEEEAEEEEEEPAPVGWIQQMEEIGAPWAPAPHSFMPIAQPAPAWSSAPPEPVPDAWDGPVVFGGDDLIGPAWMP